MDPSVAQTPEGVVKVDGSVGGGGGGGVTGLFISHVPLPNAEFARTVSRLTIAPPINVPFASALTV